MKHKGKEYTIWIVVALALWAVPARAQATKVDFALYAADATVRGLDAGSTHRLLSAPWGCFREDDPLAPGGRSLAHTVEFQASASFLVIAGGYALTTHGHRRLGRLLLLADIAAEVWAVQHNLRQQPRGMVPVSVRIARPR